MWETLYFAAMLRLPRDFSVEQKKERVAKVISALGLNRCKDTIIGTSFSDISRTSAGCDSNTGSADIHANTSQSHTA